VTVGHAIARVLGYFSMRAMVLAEDTPTDAVSMRFDC
jgi:hypothetical protein